MLDIFRSMCSTLLGEFSAAEDDDDDDDDRPDSPHRTIGNGLLIMCLSQLIPIYISALDTCITRIKLCI